MSPNINFYLTDDPYGEFSNFASFPIQLNGKIWPTTEHYFQAQKFAGTEHEEQIRVELSPMKAARERAARERAARSARDSDDADEFPDDY